MGHIKQYHNSNITVINKWDTHSSRIIILIILAHGTHIADIIIVLSASGTWNTYYKYNNIIIGKWDTHSSRILILIILAHGTHITNIIIVISASRTHVQVEY